MDGGIPYPDNLTPKDGILKVLVINEYWLSVLLGFAVNAHNRRLWDVTDAEWENDVEPAVLTMLGVDVADCDSIICDIRFQDGVIEVKRGGDWIPVDDTERIVTGIGAIGNGWEVEQNGEFTAVPNEDGCGNCEAFPDMPAYEGSGAARSCSIAQGMVEWFMEKYQDSLDQLEATENSAVAADFILAIFPPLYLAWDAVSDAVDEWYEAGISVARALDTVEWREEMTEKLYCLLINDDNIFTEGVWNDFKEWCYLTRALVGVYVLMFTYDGANNQAHKMSYGEASGCETFNCTDCVVYESFVNAPEEETYEIIEGEYDDGLNVFDVGTVESDYVAKVIVRFNTAGMGEVGEITYKFKAENPVGATNPRNHYQIIRVKPTGGSVSTVFDSFELLNAGTEYERTRTFSPDDMDYVEVEVFAGWGLGQFGTMILDDTCIK